MQQSKPINDSAINFVVKAIDQKYNLRFFKMNNSFKKRALKVFVKVIGSTLRFLLSVPIILHKYPVWTFFKICWLKNGQKKYKSEIVSKVK